MTASIGFSILTNFIIDTLYFISILFTDTIKKIKISDKSRNLAKIDGFGFCFLKSVRQNPHFAGDSKN
jgi:hypothetical protein